MNPLHRAMKTSNKTSTNVRASWAAFASRHDNELLLPVQISTHKRYMLQSRHTANLWDPGKRKRDKVMPLFKSRGCSHHTMGLVVEESVHTRENDTGHIITGDQWEGSLIGEAMQIKSMPIPQAWPARPERHAVIKQHQAVSSGSHSHKYAAAAGHRALSAHNKCAIFHRHHRDEILKSK